MLFLIFLGGQPSAHADDFQCEVMSLEGSAFVTNSQVTHQPLKEGDILKTDDLVEVDANSYVDLGYDKDWKNTTRVEEKSKVEIKSLFPTTLKMAYGGVFAKLKELPKESTFEVETPTAIASVRGTEYRTVHQEDGTQVYNFSDSKVYVFGQDEEGHLSETPMIVENAQMTQVDRPGASPARPKPMAEAERQKGGRFKEGMEKKILENISRGRFAKVADMQTIDRMHHEKMAAIRSGRGKLVSLGSGQVKEDRMQGAIGHEDRMIRMMDRANQKYPEKPVEAHDHQGLTDAKLQNNSASQSGNQFKKNDQTLSNVQGEDSRRYDDKKRKPRQGNFSQPSKPPR